MSKKIKLHKQKDNEWVQPGMRGYILGCCDCGLLHSFDFRIATGKKRQAVQFRAKRLIRKTNLYRKQEGIKVKI